MSARQISFFCVNIQKLVLVVIFKHVRKFLGKNSSRCHNFRDFRGCSRMMSDIVWYIKQKTEGGNDTNPPSCKLAVVLSTGHGPTTLHMDSNLCTHDRSWPSRRITLSKFTYPETLRSTPNKTCWPLNAAESSYHWPWQKGGLQPTQGDPTTSALVSTGCTSTWPPTKLRGCHDHGSSEWMPWRRCQNWRGGRALRIDELKRASGLCWVSPWAISRC